MAQAAVLRGQYRHLIRVVRATSRDREVLVLRIVSFQVVLQ